MLESIRETECAALSRASPKFVLMTGATGLLGSYLVRDLLLDDAPLALLVRGGRRQSAGDRVEGLVRHWEEAIGRPLRRPRVLEGDVCRPLCGLDRESLGWVSRHCGALLHNAASLTFRGSDRDADPWLTNVGGTRHALELARSAGLRHLHHVSTAYVCGQRQGLVREDELDVGQDFGNDYERSKVEAELLVTGAGHLDTATIYRPSIIVGDSRTGFTSTYHGLFAVLRLGHTLLTRVVKGATSGPALVGLLGLGPEDGKNFVPVDWVSAVIAHAVQHPAARGRVYHVTHPEPLTMDTIGRLVQEAVETFSEGAAPDDPDLRDETWFAESLRSQLDIYRSYLRNDPVFDRTHLDAIAGHLPCPALDMPALLRMARFAIETGFGRRQPGPAARPPVAPVRTAEPRPAVLAARR